MNNSLLSVYIMSEKKLINSSLQLAYINKYFTKVYVLNLLYLRVITKKKNEKPMFSGFCFKSLVFTWFKLANSVHEMHIMYIIFTLMLIPSIRVKIYDQNIDDLG